MKRKGLYQLTITKKRNQAHMNIIPENLSTFGNDDLRKAETLFAKRNKIKYCLLDKFQRAHTLYSSINSLATPLPPASMFKMQLLVSMLFIECL